MDFLEAVEAGKVKCDAPKSPEFESPAIVINSMEKKIDDLNKRLDALIPGETIIIDGLSDDVYHGSKGVSCSKIKVFIDCAFEYWAKYVGLTNLKEVAQKEKDYYAFGKAAHCVVLEPDVFDKKYIRMPDTVKVRNGAKWEEVEAEAISKGQTILTKTHFDEMAHVKAAIDNNKTARLYCTGGIAERSYFTRDKETNLIVKVRPDYEIGDLITDLKTSDTANPRLTDRKFKNLGYHIQDAMYSDISGKSDFVFVVMKSKRPYTITAPVIMSDDLKRLGYLEYRKALRGIKSCMESGVWPMYTKKPHYVEANKFDIDRLNKLEEELL